MAGRKQKSSCFGTAIAILFGFAVLYGCASSCTSSKSPKPQSPPTSIPAEDQILKTMVAEIQLSYTPTITLTPTPSFTPTDESTAEIALIPTLSTSREPSSSTLAQQKYIVQDGDTCWGIAVDKYKIPLESFLAANGISAAYCDISVGQEVVIPAADYPVPTALPYAAPTSVPVYIAPTAAPVYAAPAVVAPASDYAAPSESECNPNYIDVCLPMYGNVRCKDIKYTRFRHNGYDPFGLDRDGDGICCEGK
ncbi:hypothetical protein BEQ56_00800 [Anaerolineaceae bacterium oral taxon 439]|nr:hypothetical protein BEQ56_00800 [Anaerolineaceae bacterium oral taxon 439]